MYEFVKERLGDTFCKKGTETKEPDPSHVCEESLFVSKTTSWVSILAELSFAISDTEQGNNLETNNTILCVMSCLLNLK